MNEENPPEECEITPARCKIFEPSEADHRWMARVDAAKAAVVEAEQATAQATVPHEQTCRFRELKQKQWELQEAMRKKW